MEKEYLSVLLMWESFKLYDQEEIKHTSVKDRVYSISLDIWCTGQVCPYRVR